MTNTYQLENQFLKATFKAEGAELISLVKDSTEYIWNGDSAFWNRHTPVLFPFVGSEINNTYFYKKTAYTIGQHGFARDQKFTIVEHSKNKITFQLKPNKASLKIYPFDFILELSYILTGKHLTTAYSVKNPSTTEDLYFSIGGHPAFKCPFKEHHKREEYSILFDNQATPKAQALNNGLRTNENYVVFKEKGCLELTKNVFYKDAIIFNPNPFSKASFIHNPTGTTYMSITFKDFPYLGIWSKNKEAPFVCIEPWYGIADHENHNQELTQKEGILKLSGLATFNCEYVISIP